MENLNNIKFKPSTQFAVVFQITRKVTFEVHYTIKEDGSHYFSTMANLFNQPKTDYKECGQCQNKVLPHLSKAYHFYKKWDRYHCKPIIDKEVWKNLIEDIIILTEAYNNAVRESTISFELNKRTSMLPLKKKNK